MRMFKKPNFISAIVLAAGMSTRMGRDNKMLYQVEGIPMIEHVMEALLPTHFDEIIVVLGHEAQLVRTAIPVHEKVRCITNARYPLGMSTSIKQGVDHLDKNSTHCAIILGDMPFIKTSHFDLLIQKVIEAGHNFGITVPTYKGKQGHPIFFTADLFEALKSLPDSDKGAKSILKSHHDQIQFVSFDHDCILQDIDRKL